MAGTGQAGDTLQLLLEILYCVIVKRKIVILNV